MEKVNDEEPSLALWGSEEEVEEWGQGGTDHGVSVRRDEIAESKKKELVKREEDGDSSQPDDHLSYEARREQNIRRNMELLRSLSLPQIAPPRPPPRFRAPRTSGAKRKRAEDLPRRKSSRLRGKDPSDYASAGVDYKMEELENVKRSNRRWPYRQSLPLDTRVPELRGDLDLNTKEVCKSGTFGVEALEALGDVLRSLEGESGEEEAGLAVGKQELERELGIHMRDHVRVTPKRIFSLCCHPSSSLLLAAVGDAVGNVGIFQGNYVDSQWEEYYKSEPYTVTKRGVRNNADADLAFTLLEIHSRPVRCVQFGSHAMLLSCSDDGLFRATDIETKNSFLCAQTDDNGTYLTSFCSLGHTDTSVVANSKGSVAIVDRRTPKQWLSSPSSHTLHDRKIFCVDTYPAKHMLASSCIDGSVALWDTRFMISSSRRKTQQNSLVRMQVGGTRGVTSALFEPPSYRSLRESGGQGRWTNPTKSNQSDSLLLLATCNDDKLVILDVGKANSPLDPLHEVIQIKHDTELGRNNLVANIQAEFDPHQRDTVMVGSKHREVNLYSVGSTSAKVKSMSDSQLRGIPSRNVRHPRRVEVFTATSRGYVYVWRPMVWDQHQSAREKV
mmetsp:Transcript_24458/g.68557  ORF Transcript_24458/g.68557 Transcript_24458/m.68557 type:complete len:614 (+) Transcript_24458:275-2116(+)